MQAIKDDLVPVFIVAILLGVYAVLQVQRAIVSDDLSQLVTTVVVFYFGRASVTATTREVRRTAAAIAEGTNGKPSEG